MSIEMIVSEVLQTRVLTHRQQRHINTLLLRAQYSESDFAALNQLYAAMDAGTVVSGGDSLAPVLIC
jgi:hypothetical protein